MTNVQAELSFNRRIKEWKASLKAAEDRARRAEQCREGVEVELAKAEAALRNMAREHAAEKARADRAEAALRSFGGRAAQHDSRNATGWQ